MRLLAAGSIAALVAWAIFVVDRIVKLSGTTAQAVIVVIATVVGLVSLISWFSGPPALRRERYLVLVPLFLIAPVGLISLHDLGGGLVVIVFSGAVGFAAAIGLGIAIADRRTRTPPSGP